MYAVKSYIKLLSRPMLPDILVQTIAWVLGEYAYLAEDVEQEDVLDMLCDLAEQQFEGSETRGWVLSAIMKQVAQLGEIPEQVQEIVEKFLNSKDVDLQQRCHELLQLWQRSR